MKTTSVLIKDEIFVEENCLYSADLVKALSFIFGVSVKALKTFYLEEGMMQCLIIAMQLFHA